jgi:uncharacterized membrane protein
MAFCSKCGSAITEGTAFCSRCGAPASAAAAGGPGPSAAGAMASNVAGLLAYILGFLTGILFLILEPYKNDRFVRFHAFQSIFFNIAIVVFWIVWMIISSVLSIISLGILGILMALIGVLIGLAIFGFWIFLMYKAYNNERFMIPFIGEIAAKQAG